MKKSIAILIFITLIQILGTAQESVTIEYRITAVKKGDPTIVSESNIIATKPPLTIYIPNAFTPNNDGLNDEFGALGYGVQNYSMKIFNRWGELLFESDDFNQQWNGYYRNEKVMAGSYIYEITASGYYNNNYQKSGIITIIKT